MFFSTNGGETLTEADRPDPELEKLSTTLIRRILDCDEGLIVELQAELDRRWRIESEKDAGKPQLDAGKGMVYLRENWLPAALFPHNGRWSAVVLDSPKAHALNVVGKQMLDLPRSLIKFDMLFRSRSLPPRHPGQRRQTLPIPNKRQKAKRRVARNQDSGRNFFTSASSSPRNGSVKSLSISRAPMLSFASERRSATVTTTPSASPRPEKSPSLSLAAIPEPITIAAAAAENETRTLYPSTPSQLSIVSPARKVPEPIMIAPEKKETPTLYPSVPSPLSIVSPIKRIPSPIVINETPALYPSAPSPLSIVKDADYPSTPEKRTSVTDFPSTPEKRTPKSARGDLTFGSFELSQSLDIYHGGESIPEDGVKRGPETPKENPIKLSPVNTERRRMKRAASVLGKFVINSEEEATDAMQDIFNKYDIDGNGSISISELKKAYDDFGFGLCEDKVEEIFNSFDTNHSGGIDFDEFKEATQDLAKQETLVEREKNILARVYRKLCKKVGLCVQRKV